MSDPWTITDFPIETLEIDIEAPSGLYKAGNFTHEVSSDGATVWVNDHEGTCLARFSKTGIDVHKDRAGQEEGGHCLDCKPGPCDFDDWRRFQAAVKEHHGIEVKDRHIPNYLRLRVVK